MTLLTAALALACNGDDGSASSGSESATGVSSTSASASASASESATMGSATMGSASEGSGSSSSGSTTEPETTGSTSTTGPTSTGDPTTDGSTTDATSTGSTTGEPGPVCGNGIVEGEETCDDGDMIDNNACSNTCTKVPCDQQEGGDLGDVLSFIWISNSSEGTVSKINTKTAIEEGRYKVAGGSPSRTSVNLQGDVAVSSRDAGAVTKIAAKEENCYDANNDGIITTSTGPGDVKALGQDECVIWTKMIGSTGYGFGPRATAWDSGAQDPETCEFPSPRLWIGWMDTNYLAHFERLDGQTGDTLDQVTYPWGNSYSPYGGAVDAEGNFYATGLNTSPTIKIDAETVEITDLGNPNGCKYGMTLDGNGDIWAGACFGEGTYHWDHIDNTWTTLPDSGGTRVNGIMADADGNVWGAGSNSCRLVHIDVETESYVNNNIPLPGCSQPWGVSIDFEGYVWVVDKGNKAFKVDPDTYEVVATVNGLVGPYTYSDMTGVALKQQVMPQ